MTWNIGIQVHHTAFSTTNVHPIILRKFGSTSVSRDLLPPFVVFCHVIITCLIKWRLRLDFRISLLEDSVLKSHSDGVLPIDPLADIVSPFSRSLDILFAECNR